jgi:hypothetical protein
VSIYVDDVNVGNWMLPAERTFTVNQVGAGRRKGQ